MRQKAKPRKNVPSTDGRSPQADHIACSFHRALEKNGRCFTHVSVEPDQGVSGDVKAILELWITSHFPKDAFPHGMGFWAMLLETPTNRVPPEGSTSKWQKDWQKDWQKFWEPFAKQTARFADFVENPPIEKGFAKLGLCAGVTVIWCSTGEELLPIIQRFQVDGEIVERASEEVQKKLSEVFEGLVELRPNDETFFADLRGIDHSYHAELAKHVARRLNAYLSDQHPETYEEKKLLAIKVNKIIREFGLAIFHPKGPCTLRVGNDGETGRFRLEASRLCRPANAINLQDLLPFSLVKDALFWTKTRSEVSL